MWTTQSHHNIVNVFVSRLHDRLALHLSLNGHKNTADRSEELSVVSNGVRVDNDDQDWDNSSLLELKERYKLKL